MSSFVSSTFVPSFIHGSAPLQTCRKGRSTLIVQPCARVQVHAPPKTDTKVVTVDPFKDAPPKQTSHYPRPVVIVPGYGADASAYIPMANTLATELGTGCDVRIAPIRASTWMKTFGGRPVTPILDIIDKSVKSALESTGADSVTLVAHSAAGWISRIYLGDVPYPDKNGKAWNGEKLVHSVFCLGTPHTSAEPVTLKNMTFVNEAYPGAFFDDVRFICLAGDGGSVLGGELWKFWRKDWLPKVSYWITTGKVGSNTGDGIVPLEVAFLNDADKNIRLRGVWHSPNSQGTWYGDPKVVAYWSKLIK